MARYHGNTLVGKVGPDGYCEGNPSIRGFVNPRPLDRLPDDPWHLWIVDSGVLYRLDRKSVV